MLIKEPYYRNINFKIHTCVMAQMKRFWEVRNEFLKRPQININVMMVYFSEIRIYKSGNTKNIHVICQWILQYLIPIYLEIFRKLALFTLFSFQISNAKILWLFLCISNFARNGSNR